MGLEQYAVAEVVVGDVGDGRTGVGSLPVGVEDERVVRAVEDAILTRARQLRIRDARL